MLAELMTLELERTLTRAADSLALARGIRRDLESSAPPTAPEHPWRP